MAKNMNDFKPVRFTIEAIFDADNRKVTPADLERAGQAALVAFRTSLEGRTPAYKIKSIEGVVEYLYVQAQKVVSLKATKKLLKKAI